MGRAGTVETCRIEAAPPPTGAGAQASEEGLLPVAAGTAGAHTKIPADLGLRPLRRSWLVLVPLKDIARLYLVGQK